MTFSAVTPDEMRAAQILTGATFALWLAVGLAPGVRPYATQIRVVLLIIYLLGIAGFVVYYLLLK